MGTPNNYTSALLDFAGIEISNLIRDKVPTSSRILDIGAGWGKYRFLLPEYEMDALDVWSPYIEKHKLDAYYRNVFIVDAAEYVFSEHYGAIIMGDVLEHIPIQRAQKVIREACSHADYVFIATPFEMEQEEVEDNPYEAHQQDDLTEEIMKRRYPQLKLYKKFGRPNEHVKAIYVKKDVG